MKIDITFSPEEMGLVLQALGELPAKHSLNLLNRLRYETQTQLAPKPSTDTTPAQQAS